MKVRTCVRLVVVFNGQMLLFHVCVTWCWSYYNFLMDRGIWLRQGNVVCDTPLSAEEWSDGRRQLLPSVKTWHAMCLQSFHFVLWSSSSSLRLLETQLHLDFAFGWWCGEQWPQGYILWSNRWSFPTRIQLMVAFGVSSWLHLNIAPLMWFWMGWWSKVAEENKITWWIKRKKKGTM